MDVNVIVRTSQETYDLHFASKKTTTRVQGIFTHTNTRNCGGPSSLQPLPLSAVSCGRAVRKVLLSQKAFFTFSFLFLFFSAL